MANSSTIDEALSAVLIPRRIGYTILELGDTIIITVAIKASSGKLDVSFAATINEDDTVNCASTQANVFAVTTQQCVSFIKRSIRLYEVKAARI